MTIPQPPEPQNPDQSGAPQPPQPLPPQPVAPAAPPLPPYGQQPPVPEQPAQPAYTQPDPYGQQPQYGAPAAPQQPGYGAQPGYPAQPGYAPQPGYGAQTAYAPAAAPTETLAIIGIIAAFIFWPAGLVINPMALSKIKKNGSGGRGLALAGLIVSIIAAIGSIIAIIASIISFVIAASAVGGIAEAVEEASEGTTPGTSESAAYSVALGELGTTDSGLGFRVDAVECGIPQVGEGTLSSTPVNGQYCKVDMTFVNNSPESVYFSTSYGSGFVGETEYLRDSAATTWAETEPGTELFGDDVAAGAELSADLYFDIPTDATLDRIVFAPITYTDGYLEVVL